MKKFTEQLVEEMRPLDPTTNLYALDLLHQASELPDGLAGDVQRRKALEYARTLGGVTASLGLEQRFDDEAVHLAISHILGDSIRIQ